MISPFSIDTQVIRRIAYAMMAALLAVITLPVFQPKAGAAEQLQSRFIQMSDASPSGGSIVGSPGSGASVTYQVGFTVVTTGANSIVIDFCDGPIIGDTCNAPTGMVATGATLGTTVTGEVVIASGWSVTAASASQIRIADDDTANPMTAVQQSFNITGITNPSTIGTFFARILTFDNETFGTYTGPAGVNVGNYLDYGGIALSINRVITITARVQEQLTFCVTAADPATWLAGGGGTAGECSASEVGAAPPAVVLGHGSPTATLDDSVDLLTALHQCHSWSSS
jgi:hypothetical protein